MMIRSTVPLSLPRTSGRERASPTRISARRRFGRANMRSRFSSAKLAQRPSSSTPRARRVEQRGLDNRGPDAGHDVDDHLAGGRVLGDDAPGELGEHLAWVCGAVRGGSGRPAGTGRRSGPPARRPVGRWLVAQRWGWSMWSWDTHDRKSVSHRTVDGVLSGDKGRRITPSP